MFLIVDANILFSFFKFDSVRRRIISSIASDTKLISPDFVFEELSKEKEKIKRYAKIDDIGFIVLFSLIEREIKSVPRSEYDSFLARSKELAPHKKDTPYFALALSLNCAIWSDEKSFKQQSVVKIYSTNELAQKFRVF